MAKANGVDCVFEFLFLCMRIIKGLEVDARRRWRCGDEGRVRTLLLNEQSII